MAAPKGMPEFAKGNAAATAASKKETALKKEVEKKPLATAPKAAISNAAAASNSNINKYDVAKADKNADNSTQAAAILKQIVKQAPAQPPTPKQISAPIAPSTPVSDPKVEAFKQIVSPSPVQPLGAQLGNSAKPVEGMPVQATGNIPAIQQYTASNVAPMTEEQKQQAFLQSVNTRMGIEKDLMGSRFVPPSQTTLQNKALDFVNTSLQNAQDRTATPQVSSNVVAPNGSNMFNYPSQQPPQASATSEALKKLITSGNDGGDQVKVATNKGAVPISDEEYAKQYDLSGAFRNTNLGQPPVVPTAPSNESVTPDWLVDTGPTYVTPEEDAAAKAKGVEEERLRKEKEAADAIAAKVKAEAEVKAGTGTTTPPEVVPPSLKDIPTADQPVDTGPTAEEYQKAAEESAYAEASRQVNDQIAAQNAEYDAQINLALNNRDYQTAQALEVKKQATEQMVKNQFIQAQQIEQNMANRGILNSGIATDAQIRLQMSMNDNIRGLETKRMETAQKLAGDFQTRLDDINLKRQKLESGRAGDVTKLANGILKDVDALNKANLDLRKLQIDENKILMANAKSSLDRLAKQGYNTVPFEALATSGDTEALARAMAQSGEPSLSLLGKDMSQQIEKTKADILLTRRNAERSAMNTKQTLSQIDKQRSDTTGYIFMNGVMIKDSKNNPIRTPESILNDRKMTDAEKRTAVTQANAATARAKASQATSKNATATTVTKPMTNPQQLNFLQDTLSTLVVPKYETQLDSEGKPVIDLNTMKPLQVRVGDQLNPSNVSDFNDIMRSLYSSGAVNNTIISNQYRAFGLAVPEWAKYPYGSIQQRDASTVDAFNNKKQQ